MGASSNPLSLRAIVVGIFIAVSGAVIAGLILAYLIGDRRTSVFLSPESVDARSSSPQKPANVLAPLAAGHQSAPIDQYSATAPSSPEINGEWNLTDTIETTTYSSYNNTELVFRVSVNQVGERFTAEGRKWLLNGSELSVDQRTAIHIKGSIHGDNVEATFVEDGIRRTSTGRFNWKIENEGKSLRGRFFSNAANSNGTSIMSKR